MGQSDNGEEIQSGTKAVNPVNVVNDEPCEIGDSHGWTDSVESDGKTRRFCLKCYKFGGFVRADGVLVQTLEELEDSHE